MRAVLLGEDPPVHLTQRAKDRLSAIREETADTAHPGGTVITRDPGGEIRWWTWGGFRVNAMLAATLSGIASPGQRVEEDSLRLRDGLTLDAWKTALAEAIGGLSLPEVDRKALNGLKFSVALPTQLAERTLAMRLADLEGAALILSEPIRWVVS
ncbi:hypothetical protein ACQP2K_17360 [Microbispora siamensis]